LGCLDSHWGGRLFFFQLQTQRERRTGESKPMLLLSTKEITIGNSVVKLYSIDGGKIWFSRPRDLQLFKQRRSHHVKIVKKLVSAHVKN
jgi:hypothetical protein